MNRLDRLYSPPEIHAPGQRRGRALRRDLRLSGLFVLAMLGVVVATLHLLDPGRLGRVERVLAYFQTAHGLRTGTQVMQDGYVIGLVERVTPIFGADPDAGRCPEPRPSGAPDRPCFRATLRIVAGWPLPRDSTARLESISLLQNDVVGIQPGTHPDSLRDGDVIGTRARQPDAIDQVGLLGETLRAALDPAEIARLPRLVAATLEKTETLVDQLGKQTDALGRSLHEFDQTLRGLRAAIQENRPALRQSLDDGQVLLRELTNALAPILGDVEETTRNLSALSRELRRDPAALILRRRPAAPEPPGFDQ